MGASSGSKVVAGNAIQALTIVGWAKTTKGKPVSVQFTREQPSPVEPTRTWRGEVLPNGPPARPPSKLPAPGTNELIVSVGDLVGEGRCGTIFSVDSLRMMNLKDPSFRLLYPQFPYLPELVIKVAAVDRSENLNNEAAIYDEMEVLQGVSVPRCYGLFTADLGEDIILPSLAQESFSPSNSSGNRTISILLLERVGELLPLGDKLPEEGDLWDVFRDLARLGIEQPDIRYSNILQAPSSPSSFPGGICPYHGTVHHYRIIDFDSARKTDLTLKRHYFNTLAYLEPILENMKQNVIVEPWDIRSKTDRPTAL